MNIEAARVITRTARVFASGPMLQMRTSGYSSQWGCEEAVRLCPWPVRGQQFSTSMCESATQRETLEDTQRHSSN